MLFFTIQIIVLAAFSQSQNYQEDSLKLSKLTYQKVQALNALSVKNFLYLYSNAESFVIMYELKGKIKAEKIFYKRSGEPIFKNLKLSKKNKSNFSECLNLDSQDSTIEFLNCKDFVHSFNQISFLISANGHIFQGKFTSDCADSLNEKGLICLYNIYRNLIF